MSTGPVLFAFDDTDGARRALEQGAQRLAAREAVVVCAWTSLERAAGIGSLGMPASVAQSAVDSFDEESERNALAAAEAGAQTLRAAGWTATARAARTTTNDWAALLAVADEVGADTIVAGSRGRSALKATLLGSVSSGLVQHSPVPVLIVR